MNTNTPPLRGILLKRIRHIKEEYPESYKAVKDLLVDKKNCTEFNPYFFFLLAPF
jgi:hypothetical protein